MCEMKQYLQVCVYVLIGFLPAYSFADTFSAHCRNYPPDLFFDGNKCVGIIPELVTDIFSDLGHDIIWLNAPWSRSYREAEKGNVDLMIRHSMIPERRSVLLPITYGYDIRSLSFYKSPNFKGDIKSYEDLEKVNVGAIRGAYYSPRFSNIVPVTLTLVGETKQLLEMLERERIDIAVTSVSQSAALFAARFEKATFVDSFINHFYISIPKKSKAVGIYDAVSERMLEYRKSGKINQYFERYGAKPPQQIYE